VPQVGDEREVSAKDDVARRQHPWRSIGCRSQQPEHAIAMSSGYRHHAHGRARSCCAVLRRRASRGCGRPVGSGVLMGSRVSRGPRPEPKRMAVLARSARRDCVPVRQGRRLLCTAALYGFPCDQTFTVELGPEAPVEVAVHVSTSKPAPRASRRLAGSAPYSCRWYDA